MKKYFLWLCGILVALGIVGRFSLLNLSLEYDELFTAITVNPSLSFSWIISHYLLIDVHPPLFNFLLWGWNQFGPWTHEVWLHIPSLLFSLGAVVVGWYRFPKQFSQEVRLIFILLLACSMSNLHYASQARSYSLLLFLSVLFTFSFLDILYKIKKSQSPSQCQIILYSLWGLLISYTHYFGLSLFCAMSIALIGAMYYFKCWNRRFFICVLVVFNLACIWLIPNLWHNIQANRFGGNWWAQHYTIDTFCKEFFSFFLTSEKLTFWIGLFNIGLIGYYYKQSNTKDYKRNVYELIFLVGSVLLMLAAVALISLKAFMFVARFFTALLPVLYMIYALLLGPLVKRFPAIWIVFLAYIVWNLVAYGIFWQARTYTHPDNAKQFAQYLLSKHPNKELFVVIKEGLPDEALEEMMGWYVRQYYRKNIKVTVLNTLSNEEFEKVIKHQDQAIIWMPLCAQSKLNVILFEQRRYFIIKEHVGRSCVLTYKPLFSRLRRRYNKNI